MKAALQETRVADQAAPADESIGVEAGAGPSVGRYTVFELDVPYSETGVANVWDNVKVTAVFTSPSNKTITVHGFYLGTNDWKVRFAPWEIGGYSYHVTVSGGASPKTNRWIVQQRGVDLRRASCELRHRTPCGSCTRLMEVCTTRSGWGTASAMRTPIGASTAAIPARANRLSTPAGTRTSRQWEAKASSTFSVGASTIAPLTCGKRSRRAATST